jgi:uncharacterized protein (DUF2235 family)
MARKKIYSSDLEYTGEGRNLIVLLDGTWNDENGKDGDGVTTNIYRMFCSISGELDDRNVPFLKTHDCQVAMYFRGLGNDEDHGVIGTFYEGAFGAGEKRIRDNAYTEILNQYRLGDRICIFGFSRGAACARLLASKLQEHGIMSEVEVHYKEEKGESYFLKYKHVNDEARNVDIEFLGLFDTVGAFGIPVNLPGLPFQKLNLFKNLSVAGNVRQTVHCVAIDESREAFIPTLCERSANVDEVWFAGVHADVGGGYRYAELGKITLAYMVRRINECLRDTPIVFDEQELQKHIHYSIERDEIRMHYHGEGLKKNARDIYVSLKNKKSKYKPRIHQSVFELMAASDIRLAEEFASFTTVTPILYEPGNLKILNNKLHRVD